MAITATSGIFGWGLNAAGGKGSAPTVWYKHRSADIDLAILDDVRLATPEIGGIPTPTFPYKAGYMAGGGATIFPRLKDTIGPLLLATLGADDIVTNAGKSLITDAAVAGLIRHDFAFASTASFVPYLGFKKVIPHDESAKVVTETYTDCKIVGLTLNFPNDGPISARIDAVGCGFSTGKNLTNTWNNANYEDWDSAPISTVTGGYVKFAGTTLPVVGASVALVNSPLDIRMEKVYGSPQLEAVTIVGRSVSFDILVKWNDPDLYQQIVTGSAGGTSWTATPLTGAVSILGQSVGLIGTTPLNIPYAIRVDAPNVLLQQVGGVRLGSGQSLMLRLNGTALAPSSGNYVTIGIHNTHSGAYALP